jgi:hypothetical protein
MFESTKRLGGCNVCRFERLRRCHWPTPEGKERSGTEPHRNDKTWGDDTPPWCPLLNRRKGSEGDIE